MRELIEGRNPEDALAEVESELGYKIEIVLMDHNQLIHGQEVLEAAVVEIFDHHVDKTSENDYFKKFDSNKKHIVYGLGSNVTLVANDILEQYGDQQGCPSLLGWAAFCLREDERAEREISIIPHGRDRFDAAGGV